MRVHYFKLSQVSKYFFGCTIAVLAAVLFTLIVQQDIPVTSQNYTHIINKIQTNKKAVSLTFNVGPETPTEPVRKILKNKQTSSTFFIHTAWAQKHQDIIHRMYLDRHDIGILLDKSYSKDYEKIYKQVIGKSPSLARFDEIAPPEKLLNQVYSEGYQIIGSKTLNEVDNSEMWLQPGNILSIPLDDSINSSKLVTRVMNTIKEKQYSAVTVSQLFSYGPGISEQ
ncbi:MAG: polysaccharide deacetylase family protein [Clostridiales bacterium]|nr:polysaccharide deacetylase family protein [Clostridiales bacterium]MCF8022373.1 polysaccharide deacetylase family protein [Clostridiales bacterium]